MSEETQQDLVYFYPSSPTDREHVQVPDVQPAQARRSTIETNLGCTDGWSFVEYVVFDDNDPHHCELSGMLLSVKGVRIANDTTGKTVLCGTGIAKKYTDVKLPPFSGWENYNGDDDIDMLDAFNRFGDLVDTL